MTRHALRMATLFALTAVPLVGCTGESTGPMDLYNIEPRAGATSGEQPVRISGANFRQDIGYAIYFGSERATSVTIMDTSTLLVTTPQHEAGRVDVVVAADDGPAFRVHDAFEYTEQGGSVMQQMGSGGAAGPERY